MNGGAAGREAQQGAAGAAGRTNLVFCWVQHGPSLDKHAPENGWLKPYSADHEDDSAKKSANSKLPCWHQYGHGAKMRAWTPDEGNCGPHMARSLRHSRAPWAKLANRRSSGRRVRCSSPATMQFIGERNHARRSGSPRRTADAGSSVTSAPLHGPAAAAAAAAVVPPPLPTRVRRYWCQPVGYNVPRGVQR